MADQDTSQAPAPAPEQAKPLQEAPAAAMEPEAVQSEPTIETPPAEAQTAQIPVSEPLAPEPPPTHEASPSAQGSEGTQTDGQSEPIAPQTAPVESPAESVPEPLGQATKSADSPAPAQNAPAQSSSTTAPVDSRQVASDRLVKARASIQDRKRKKLEKILEALDGKGPTTLKLRRAGKITNDEVEKLLHVSDATATRYLSALEKEGKLKQIGKTGIGVVYEKI